MKNKLKEATIELNKKGWTVVKGFLTKRQVSNYKKNIFKYLKKNHLNFKGRHINYVGNTKKFSDIHSFHKLEEYKKIKDFI